jgi:hypothetical protein
MFNKPKMIIRSTKLNLTAEPFLLVLLKRVLCSRCGLSSDKLPTEKGKNELKLFLGGLFLFYITFASFSIPKTAPIANAPATTFFIGVQTNGVLPFEGVSVWRFSDFVRGVDVVLVPEYGSKNFWLFHSRPPKPIFNFGLATTKKLGGSDVDVFGTTSPSIISPILYLTVIFPSPSPSDARPELVAGMRVEKSFVKINFAIMIFFSKVRGTDKHNFFTFYKFEKFDRAWAKSFNSFLLPLKFIRRENVAMEHNVLWLGVCYFALQTFQALDKFNRQNNSTKPLLVAGAVN